VPPWGNQQLGPIEGLQHGAVQMALLLVLEVDYQIKVNSSVIKVSFSVVKVKSTGWAVKVALLLVVEVDCIQHGLRLLRMFSGCSVDVH
jgi:hypothetical protein